MDSFIGVYGLFLFFGIIASFFKKWDKKNAIIFFLPMMVLLFFLFLYAILLNEIQNTSEFGLRILLFAGAYFLPFLVVDRSSVFKFSVLIFLMGLLYFHHYTMRKVDMRIIKENLSLQFEGVHYFESGLPFEIPDHDFFVFTYNVNCAVCPKLVSYLKENNVNATMPVYAIKIVHRKEVDTKYLPAYILDLGLPSTQILIVDPVNATLRNEPAPTSFFYRPKIGLKIIEGFRDGSFDHFEGLKIICLILKRQ